MRPPIQPLLLDSDKVHTTVQKLQQRIQDRFPGSGLGKVCGHLVELARITGERSQWMRRPLYRIRLLAWVITLALVAFSIGSLVIFSRRVEQPGLTEFIQVIEAGMNDLVLIGAAIYFLHRLELRAKRNRALASIHELRSLAHIIDMHQLTKDPDRVLQSDYLSTPSSPTTALTPFLLRRYLDYCSEMLSLTAKLAAIYAQDLDDPIVLSAVSEVETMTTDLSRKIWQKFTLLDENRPAVAPRNPGDPKPETSVAPPMEDPPPNSGSSPSTGGL